MKRASRFRCGTGTLAIHGGILRPRRLAREAWRRRFQFRDRQSRARHSAKARSLPQRRFMTVSNAALRRTSSSRSPRVVWHSLVLHRSVADVLRGVMGGGHQSPRDSAAELGVSASACLPGEQATVTSVRVLEAARGALGAKGSPGLGELVLPRRCGEPANVGGWLTSEVPSRGWRPHEPEYSWHRQCPFRAAAHGRRGRHRLGTAAHPASSRSTNYR